jgi:hypothetical protein
MNILMYKLIENTEKLILVLKVTIMLNNSMLSLAGIMYIMNIIQYKIH